jgi:hypothetical protein
VEISDVVNPHVVSEPFEKATIMCVDLQDRSYGDGKIRQHRRWRLATTTTTMATARWATARQATTTVMIATSKDDDADEVDDDGDGVMGNGATGYDDIDDDGLALLATKLTIMAKARWATTTTTTATAQRDATIKTLTPIFDLRSGK